MELRGHHIFILGLMRYDNAIESTNYTVAKGLAQHNHVYYFDNPYTYKDCIRLRGTEAYGRRKQHFSARASGVVDTDVPNLKVIITPPVASINWMPEGRLYRAALGMAERTILRRMRQIKALEEIKEVIFINSFNFYYPGISKGLKPVLTIYHCVDPLVHPYELKHGESSQAQIAQESDVVICTSKQLAQEMSRLNDETFLVPNAADVAHSAKALEATLPVHPLLAKIPAPRIGYFGAIERRLDYTLLLEVAKMNGDKSFVFTGPISPEFVPDSFADVPNIFLTGPVPYSALPQVLKGFDMAMIPFKKDEVSVAIFPLKLFEYLGAGLTVVATDFNLDLSEYTGDAVSYCRDADAFSDAINRALYDDTVAAKAIRLEIAAQNTWEHRTDQFAGIINNHLTAQPVLRSTL